MMRYWIWCHCIRWSCFIFIPLWIALWHTLSSSSLFLSVYLSLCVCVLCEWSEMYGICLWLDIYGFYCLCALVVAWHHVSCARSTDNIELIANGIGYNVNKNQMYYSFHRATTVTHSLSMMLHHLWLLLIHFRRWHCLVFHHYYDKWTIFSFITIQNWDKLMGNEFDAFDFLFVSSNSICLIPVVLLLLDRANEVRCMQCQCLSKFSTPHKINV